ncbi:hypothetical protein DEJ50_00220 [Streptomyces venezuelae]|uniref:Secreted protein n=1 Tax=Streptomyces venezuelae TaxID=54571 RepID=A0A5P2CUC9_STRVZ|nr:hypothetical protein [Streptomyces venezuelae]QES46516.1 hypothetical protein DEJ50_00220 [Streptomyces venezuelae]
MSIVAAGALAVASASPAAAVGYRVAGYSANNASYAFGDYDYEKAATCQGAAPNAAYFATLAGRVDDKRWGDAYGAAVKATWLQCFDGGNQGLRWEYREEVIAYDAPFVPTDPNPDPPGQQFHSDWVDVKDLRFYTCNWNPASGAVGTCARMSKQ